MRNKTVALFEIAFSKWKCVATNDPRVEFLLAISDFAQEAKGILQKLKSLGFSYSWGFFWDFRPSISKANIRLPV